MESLANLLRSPIRLFFSLMAIYVATQSAVCALFLAIVGVSWAYHHVFGRSHVVPTPRDVSMPKPQSAAADQDDSQAPQARAYAKSPVVVPLKRQDAARRSA
ncbi:hypothetical protein [Cupriavidus pinatubonensis]|uniref:Transmembrane protein n=1 Tax=Cupriavidus pinatubonensis TaxID=248026 RepID=A0ABM8WEF4_9BURK|nr:hypothetical protein [Cupriavidus pinatubonensis]CAG9165696.1 hypothetical protein LMG23994_00785 [Cupriavidus pinatubonensis]